MKARSQLSDDDIHRLRAALSTRRDELIAAQQATEAQQRGMYDREIEQGDVAENQIEQASALRLGAFDATLLADIERALKKIDDGDYGTSEDSGAPIPVARLEAMPWARRTADEERKSRGR